MRHQRKHIAVCFFIAALFLTCGGCGAGVTPAEGAEKTDKEETQDYYHDHQETGGQIAIVFDVDSVMDRGYEQAVYEGVQSYAQSAGVSYSCYSAASGSKEAYAEAVLFAIENDAELVVCAGSDFEQAVGSLQDRYGSVSFLLLDGVPKDASGRDVSAASNVHCIAYHEEEAGYLAGYMAVLEGYRRLGFIGGEEIPSVQKYGLGYVQGIDDAAVRLDISEEISVDYWYAGTFLPDQEIGEVSHEWYEGGTEIIFACGGDLYESVLSSAETCGGRLIGVDVDQSGISELFVTSAMKGIRLSVIVALDDFYANGGVWPEELAGQVVSYGAEKKCIELPYSDDAWRFENVQADDYFQLLGEMKAGKIAISDDIGSRPETAVSVIYH